jgi:hypothetical protein
MGRDMTRADLRKVIQVGNDQPTLDSPALGSLGASRAASRPGRISASLRLRRSRQRAHDSDQGFR